MNQLQTIVAVLVVGALAIVALFLGYVEIAAACAGALVGFLTPTTLKPAE